MHEGVRRLVVLDRIRRDLQIRVLPGPARDLLLERAAFGRRPCQEPRAEAQEGRFVPGVQHIQWRSAGDSRVEREPQGLLG